MNLYHYLFYIIYKFVKLTTKEELQDHVLGSALACLFIGLVNVYTTILMITRLLNFFPNNIFLWGITFSVFPVLIYYFNWKLFVVNEMHKRIEEYYDARNKFKKIYFVLLACFYLFGSLAVMILTGIRYVS